MDGYESEAEEEMPHCASRLVERWCVLEVSFSMIAKTRLTVRITEFLQERLSQETSRPEFSQLPFRFAEIAKVILDV
jgi:hypothetical protein